ncbi:MAG: hypothetical protein AB1584_13710 [Pseudomonadota bacterium]
MREFSDDREPQEPEAGPPKFGRLLLVLVAAVLLIIVITFASEAYFS